MAEYAPEALKWLAREIIKAIPSAELSGIVGDPAHTYGYHRCRNKLPSSDYSVQTKPDREGDGDAASALDMKFNAEWMKKITRRLLDSAKDQNDPRLNYMREFFGTLDGKKVTGWDTYYGKPVTSDDSHLWHIHMSILRKYCTSKDKMANILSVIKGEDDMDLGDRVKVADWINDRWDDVGDSISVRTALGSSYGHARSAKDGIYDKVIPMLEKLTAAREGGAAALSNEDLKQKLTESLTDSLGDKFEDLDGDDLAEAVEKAVDKALDSLNS
ncbi:hypothetical protein Snas_5197 [Stackebrandtia nassauensis DSM 44728]|uniref:Uncharacterized protein n=1 Tax=Stackebrandtia nassauensis (strain DSM 44728 / CIP 108903 / NRRL B-16338 / NBRC 102104 / LLR-40K-21) TaxID=446470 RepID=D3QBU3_STANL|nr:hypothetical protein Snas_5197 [Stackebrandtia nassauensis DSM 44728]